MEEKQKMREQELSEEVAEAENIKKKQENEDKIFNSWAEQMIEQWKKDGKDIMPLLKQLKQQNK